MSVSSSSQFPSGWTSGSDPSNADEAELREEVVRLRAEVQRLRETAVRNRSLVDLTTDAAYDLLYDDGFRLTWAAASFERLTGVASGDLVDAGDWTAFVDPRDRSVFERHRDHIWHGSRMVTEYRLVDTDGVTRWVCDYAQPMASAGSSDVPQRVYGAVREITHERRYEQALRKSESKYRHIFNNSPLGICHFDADGVITQCNDNFVDIIGSSRQALVGLSMIDDLENEEVVAAVKDALETGSGSFEGRYASVTADKVTPVRVLFNGIGSSTGEIIGGVGIVEDVTERRRYEQELIAARDEAEKMNRLKSAFLANMSHEIRTPLTAIIGFADVLGDELPSTHRRLAHLIEQSGERLLETLNSVLDLSMLESGEMKLDVEVIDVNAHVEEQIDIMRPLAASKDLSLTYEGPDHPVPALLAPGGLDRILNNLIGNAIKFTDDGRVTVSVRVEPLSEQENADARPAAGPEDASAVSLRRDGEAAEPGQKHVHVAVDDTGVGISASFLPDLFDIFKQESAGLQRSHEGSGLGLAITRRLVDALGGTIRVESTKGEGSCFTVTFPVATQDAPSAQPEAPLPVHRHSEGACVLVVEDNTETALLAEHVIERHHDVDVAATADEALALARQATYDVLLIDIHLPEGRSGLTLLSDLRNLSGYEAVPAVAVTAYALAGDEQRFLAAGFDDYVSKPFTRDALLAAIDNALAHRTST